MYFLLFLTCPSLFPFPFHKKKGFFFLLFFGVLFSFLLPNPCGKPGLSPEVPFTIKKSKYRKILILLCFSVSFFLLN